MKSTRGDQIDASESKIGIRRLLAGGSWAVIEQAFFACGSFAIHVILARLLAARDYGLFAVGYAVLLFVRTIYESIVTEPMTVFGPGRFALMWARYLRVIFFKLYAPLMASFVAICLSVACILWWLGIPNVPALVGGLAIAAPCWLSFITVRRALYVVQRIQMSALLSGFYGIAVGLGLLGVSARMAMTPALGFVVIALASAVVGVTGLAALGVVAASGGTADDRLIQDVYEQHRKYGAWAFSAGLLRWLPENMSVVLLPITHGVDAVAAFRASLNFILPALQACSALRSYMTPTFVKQRLRGHLQTAIGGALRLAVVLGALYFVILLLSQEYLFDWVYGGRYAEGREMLWVLGLMVLPAAGVTVFTSGFQSLERPDLVFRAYAIATATGGLAIGVLTFAQGVFGSVLGTVLCQWLIFGAMAGKLFVLRTNDSGAITLNLRWQ